MSLVDVRPVAQTITHIATISAIPMAMASITVTPVLVKRVTKMRAERRCHSEGALELPRKGSRSGLSDILLRGCSCFMKPISDITRNGSRTIREDFAW